MLLVNTQAMLAGLDSMDETNDEQLARTVSDPNVLVLGSWVGVRRPLHLLLFLAARPHGVTPRS